MDNLQVSKVIPECGHSVVVKCGVNPGREHCNQNCEKTLICGHKCKNMCAKLCTTENCIELVLINTTQVNRLACGHDKVWILCCDRDRGNTYINVLFNNNIIY